jgi:hypothetical protein
MNQFLKTIFSLVAITTVSNNAIKAETEDTGQFDSLEVISKGQKTHRMPPQGNVCPIKILFRYAPPTLYFDCEAWDSTLFYYIYDSSDELQLSGDLYFNQVLDLQNLAEGSYRIVIDIEGALYEGSFTI